MSAPIEQPGQVVHDPSDAAVDPRPGDLSEDIPQERRRLGEDCGLTRERSIPRRVTTPRREQPIGCGLGLHIGKIGWREVADQDFPVGFEQAVQGAR